MEPTQAAHDLRTATLRDVADYIEAALIALYLNPEAAPAGVIALLGKVRDKVAAAAAK